MKTTPDDSAQLPGATGEIVLAEGVGPAQSPLVGKRRVVCAAARPPACRDHLPEQLRRAGGAPLLTEEMNL